MSDKRNRLAKQELIKRFGPYCSESRGHGCGKLNDPLNLTVDHILPRYRGGSEKLSNLQLLCQECHKKKTKEEVWYENAVGYY